MAFKTALISTGLLLLQQTQISAAYPADSPSSLFARQDDVGTSFCEGNGASWTSDLWTSNGMADFLNNRLKWYAGAGGEWPTDEGAPRAIAQFNSADQDDLWNWGTACRSASDTCDLDEGHLTGEADCAANWQRAFALWSMRNSANFVQRFYAAITDVFDTSALDIGTIVDTFIDNSNSDLELGASSWLVIVSGVIGATTAFIPGGGAAVGGMAAGVLGIGIGILGGVKKTAVDPRFTSFADMESRLGDIKTQTQNSIDTYFNELWRDTPPAGDQAAGDALGVLLESGAWADQDMAELPYTKDDMIRMIHSGIISEAWNSQRVVLVKWSKNMLGDIRGHHFDPCYDYPIEDLGDWVGCKNDRNYIFARFPDEGESPWAMLGFTEQLLQPFGINHQMLIDAAEHRQGITGEWMSRNLDFLAGDLADLAQNPPDNVAEKLVQFNIPVCDLDAIDGIKYDDNTCVGDVGCMSSVVLNNCPRLMLNDVPFPYTRN